MKLQVRGLTFIARSDFLGGICNTVRTVGFKEVKLKTGPGQMSVDEFRRAMHAEGFETMVHAKDKQLVKVAKRRPQPVAKAA